MKYLILYFITLSAFASNPPEFISDADWAAMRAADAQETNAALVKNDLVSLDWLKEFDRREMAATDARLAQMHAEILETERQEAAPATTASWAP